MENSFYINLTVVLAVLNLLTFLIMRLDKLLACKKCRRIPEKVLCTFTVIAPIGTLLAMVFPFYFGRHKCKKFKFWLSVIIGIAVNTAVIYYIIKF